MIKSRFRLFCLLSLIFSANAMAHGDHQHWTGAWAYVGSALNGMEFFKHAIVIGDQLAAEKEDRNNWVLAGNTAVAAGHIYMAAEHLLHAQAAAHSHHHGHKHKLTLLAAANVFGVVDAFVDGITTLEYWTQESSWQKAAVMLVTPTCMASNLALMGVKFYRAFSSKPKHI